MANVQRENGHIDIANTIAEKFRSTRFAGQEWQIIWTVLRDTWGVVVKNKDGEIQKDKKGWPLKEKFAWFTTYRLAEKTGIPRQKCDRLAKGLSDKCVLIRRVTQKGDGIRILYGFQKDFDKWKMSPKRVTSEKSVTQKGYGASPKRVTEASPKRVTKERKKKLSKRKVRLFQSDHTALRLAEYLVERIRLNKPDFKEPNLQSWAKIFDLMLRRDKREARQIALVIKWAQADNVPRGKGRFCWAFNVLSPTSLRESFDRLELEMKNGHEKANAPPSQDLEKTERLLEEYQKMEAESGRDPEGVKNHIAKLIEQLGDDSNPELKGEAAHEFEEKRRLLQERLKELTK